MIETQRLLITPVREVHIDEIVTLWTDPRVTQFMGGPRIAENVQVSLLEDCSKDPEPFDLWAVLEKATNQVIGHSGLLKKDIDGVNETELIYVFRCSLWGKGFATEAAVAIRDYAFNGLKQQRLVALIDPLNRASEKVALNAGMKFEKELIRPDGKPKKLYSVIRLQGRT